ncbi:hypothetical protein SIN8267_00395 [Sinobacterium norvegicum]|uniref:Filamentous haemagglutinin FhaB/tRNA nuclease CdiA-like TPS domain-containing protein n=1 Tax=Sinobacterium norvegicum TaxID=1641715 RepID=A0ABM9AAS0_9GAMM|nr:filamentous hemagglutinin N-terminal domain-containing protein [Sinobacterium norvegicum]CAH0990303.1 hypothetical protein SIN8267_00395 [Sinobacterium norvegicum]
MKKRNGNNKRNNFNRLPIAIAITTQIAITASYSSSAISGPKGGVVTSGNSTISVKNNTTTVNQSSQYSNINWQSFNVNTNEAVKFKQPNSSAVSVNNILDQSPSTIRGLVEANGRVVLINPRGLVFTETSRINVDAIVASTLQVNKDTIDQLMLQADGEGVVINNGIINAASGVHLIGHQAINNGVINGKIVSLNSASAATITFDQDNMIGIVLTKEILENDLGVDSAVINNGHINGQDILLQAKVTAKLFDSAVNNTDMISATGIDRSNGIIRLRSDNGLVKQQGTLNVSSPDNAGSIYLESKKVHVTGALVADSDIGQAGTINILGDQIALGSSALISAKGQGGGEILIGGDYKGDNPTIKNAETVVIHEGAIVDASAKETGSGGRLIVWSDHKTVIAGTLRAQGGTQSGDGGLIETSSKQSLAIDDGAIISAKSYHGNAGDWLLDPTSITIQNGAGDITVPVNVATDPFVYQDQTNPDSSTIDVALITSTMADGTSVTVSTDSTGGGSGDIVVDAAIVIVTDGATDFASDAAASATFSLQADNDIVVNNNITATSAIGGGKYHIDLEAGNDITIANSQSILTTQGDITTSSININNAGSISADAVTLNVGRTGNNSDNTLGAITATTVSVVGNTGADVIADNLAANVNITGAGTTEIGDTSFTTQSIEQLTTTGTVSNKTANSQAVTATDASLELASVKILGNGSYIGDATNFDHVNDSDNSNWTFTDANTATKNLARSFSNINKVTTSGAVTNDKGAGEVIVASSTALTAAGIQFVGNGDYTGHNSNTDSISDSDNRAWNLEATNTATKASGRQFNNIAQVSTTGAITETATNNWSFSAANIASALGITFNGSNDITTNGVITNASGISQAVTASNSVITVAGIDFTGSGNYIGDATNSDTVTDSDNNNWDVNSSHTATKNSARQFSNIDQVTSNGLITNDTGSGQSVVASNTQVTVADIDFIGTGNYIGDSTNKDAVVDADNSAWTITGTNVATKNGARQFSNIDQVTTTGNIDESSTTHWRFIGQNLASSDAGITVDGTSVITTDGTVTNDKGAGEVIVASSTALTAAGIQFVGNGDYTGHNSNTDSITDSDNSAWNLDATNTATKASGRQFNNIAQVSTTGVITETATNNWSFSAANIASALGISFDGSNDITTNGVITNASGISQAVTASNSVITVAGIDFTGSGNYIGDSTNKDAVVDADNSAWTITGTNVATKNGARQFSNIDQVTTTGNIDESSTNNWRFIGENLASSDAGITVDGTSVITTDGTVTNDKGAGEVIVASNTALTAAGIQFIGTGDYTGHNSNTDSITDSDNSGWNIDAANTATKASARQFNNIAQVSTTGAITETATNNWSFNAANIASALGITFNGSNDITTNGVITNVSGISQAVTASNSVITVAGIDFTGSGNYIGDATNFDTVTDSDNSHWNIDGSHTATKNSARQFSNISKVTGSGNITESSTTNWSVLATNEVEALGVRFVGTSLVTTSGSVTNSSLMTEAADVTLASGANLSISLLGILFDGSSHYIGSSIVKDVISDAISDHVWLLTGADQISSTISGVDAFLIENGGVINTDGTIKNTTDGSSAIDVVLTDSGAIQVSGFVFNGATAYEGSAVGLDNITDEFLSSLGWSVDGNNTLSSNGMIFTDVDSLDTTTTIFDNDVADTAWLLKGANNAASSGIEFYNITRVETDDAIVNVSSDNITVKLNANSDELELVELGMTFKGMSSYSGLNKAGSFDDIDDSIASRDWQITADQSNSLNNSDGRVFSSIDALTTSGELSEGSVNQWQHLGTTTASAAGITFSSSDSIITDGSITSVTIDNSVTIAANDEALKMGGISYIGGGSYIGSGSDNVIDLSNDDWTVTQSNGADTSTRSFTGIDQVTTTGGVTDSLDGDWLLESDTSASSAGILFNSISSIASLGKVVDLPAMDSSWNVLSSNRLDNGFITFIGTGNVDTLGDVVNASNTNQQIDVDGNSLTLAGISFSNPSSYSGGLTTIDTVVDADGRAWSINGFNQISDSGRNYSNINVLESTGALLDVAANNWTIKSANLINSSGIDFLSASQINSQASVVDETNSDWSVTDFEQANNGDYYFEGISSISSTGALINDTNQAVSLTISADNTLVLRDIVFSNISEYIAGLLSDQIVSERSVDWSITSNYHLLDDTGRSFSNINKVTGAGSVFDSQNNNWSLIASKNTSDGFIEFSGLSAVSTTGVVSNNTNAAQTINVFSTQHEVAGIDFIGAGGYIGNNNSDSVVDNAGLNWSIVADYELQAAGGRTFSQVSVLNTTESVTDTQNNDWSIINNKHFSDGFITVFNAANILTKGGVLNDTGNSLLATLVGTQKLSVADTQFDGLTSYVGDNSMDGIVNTLNDNTWQLLSGNSVSASNVRFSNINKVSGANTVAGLNTSYYINDENAVTTSGIAFTDVQSVIAEGMSVVGRSIDEVFDIAANQYQLKTAGIEFVGSIDAIDGAGGYDVINQNTVSDSRTWTISADGSLSDEVSQYANVEEVNDSATSTHIDGSNVDADFTINSDASITAAGLLFNKADQLQGSQSSLTLLADSMIWRLTNSGDSIGDIEFSGFTTLYDQSIVASLYTTGDAIFSGQQIDTGDMTYNFTANELYVDTEGAASGYTNVERLNLIADTINLSTAIDYLNALTRGGDITIVEEHDVVVGLLSTGSSSEGDVKLTSSTGSVYADDSAADYAHIIAANAEITAFLEIGSVTGQTIQIDVDNDVTFVAVTYVNPVMLGLSSALSEASRGIKIANINDILSSSGIKSAVNNIVDEFVQLDPAIFTDVKPFTIAEDSVLPPMHLRDEDEEDDYLEAYLCDEKDANELETCFDDGISYVNWH